MTPFPPLPLFQTIQIMTGFLHIGFGIVLTTLTNVYTSVFVIGEIPFLGGVSVRAGGPGRDSHQERMPSGLGCPPGREPHQGLLPPGKGIPPGRDASKWDTHRKGCPPGVMHLPLPRPGQLENKSRGCPLCPVSATSGQVWGALRAI